MNLNFFEFNEDAALSAMINTSDVSDQSLFRNELGDEDFEALINYKGTEELPEAAGLRIKKQIPSRPNAPEIVLIHGITDCHLAEVSGWRENRIWFQYQELITGSFIRNLPLQDDGSDLPGKSIQPNGHKGEKYNKSLDYWRSEGFNTHVFCYDWRKSVRSSAEKLDRFLTQLPATQEGKNVILVCHSMGGLVASTWAANYSHWENTIKHCVFVGSPLGGSYSVPMNVLGKSKSVQQMAKFSLPSLEKYQAMLASFTGLIDMLPNPKIFPDAESFYKQDGWPGSIKPSQKQLNDSLELKSKIWNSPIFSKATHLISFDYETVAEMKWNEDKTDRNISRMEQFADGVVPAISSLAPNLNAFQISGEHGQLVNERKVAQAVIAIAEGSNPELQTVDLSSIGNASLIPVAAEAMIISPARRNRGRVSKTIRETYFERKREKKQKEELQYSSLEFYKEALVNFDRQSAPTNNKAFWKASLSMAIASNDAYAKEEFIDQIKEKYITQLGFKGFKSFDSGQSTQGFVVWDDNLVVVSFRGSEFTYYDWIGTNAKIASHPTNYYGHVHLGFHKGFHEVSSELHAIVNDVYTSNKKFYLTGHSLGAAVASIAAAEWKQEFSPDGIFSFGQPKTGKKDFVQFMNASYTNNFIRFKNDQDFVTRIPPNFSHFGRLFWFDKHKELQHADSTSQEFTTEEYARFIQYYNRTLIDNAAGMKILGQPEDSEIASDGLTDPEYLQLIENLESNAEASSNGLTKAEYLQIIEKLKSKTDADSDDPTEEVYLKVIEDLKSKEEDEAAGLKILGINLTPRAVTDHSMNEQYIPLIRNYISQNLA